MPIVFAIMLNEMGSYHFKKLVQTCSYLPHFVSWVIISGIFPVSYLPQELSTAFYLLLDFTKEAIPFLNSPKLVLGTGGISGCVERNGLVGTLCSLAAISGVSQDLFEAASIDGAGRLQENLEHHSAMHQANHRDRIDSGTWQPFRRRFKRFQL